MGFAHLSRTTENNVDLNRNFIDHGQPHPANPDYAILHPQLLREDWSSAAVAAAQQAMEDFTARHGEDRLYDTLARGQYSHPDGLNYGGTAREWSNLTLERIVRDHLAGARKVALIDWHTGIGGYGEPFFLCFNEEGGPCTNWPRAGGAATASSASARTARRAPTTRGCCSTACRPCWAMCPCAARSSNSARAAGTCAGCCGWTCG